MAIGTPTTGKDTITGNNGADTLAGGLGDDTYIVNHLSNIVQEAYGGGIDTIRTGVLNALKIFSIEKIAYVENLTYTGTTAAQLVGNGLDNVINANSTTVTNDTLNGGAGNDSLSGFGGRDLLMGGTGNDTLDGGVGSDADTLIGGMGSDTYLNVTAADVIIEGYGAGFDTISTNATGGKYLDLRSSGLQNIEGLIYNGGSTAKALHGNTASNSITSTGTGADTIYGYDGSDTLNGGSGTAVDSLVGGTGNDFYYADAGDVVVELANEGTDTLYGMKTSLAVTAYANTIENLIYTGTGTAALGGNNLDNVIIGGSGANTINAGNGDDDLVGGAGNDSVLGGAGNDWLYGGSVTNDPALLMSNSGVRPIFADDGVADTLVGGAGSDVYYMDNTSDVIIESATDTGTDVIRASVDFSLATYSNVEALVLDSATTINSSSGMVTIGNSPWFAEGNAANNVILGNGAENYIAGLAGNDTLASGISESYYSGYTGTGAITDVLDGGDGDDMLVAQQGNYGTYEQAALLGGAGNDFYVVQNTNTSIHDDNGTDTAYLLGTTSGGYYAVISFDTVDLEGVERIVLFGGSAADDAKVVAAMNQISTVRMSGSDDDGGSSGSTGGGSGSTSPGSTGSTSPGSTGTTSTDSSGSYTLPTISSYMTISATGNGLANTMIGNAANNRLSGLAGNDTLQGGAGNDTLIGGTGNDSLVGGTGDDVYEIDSGDTVVELAGEGVDMIRSATLTSYAGFANIEGLEYTGSSNVLLQNGTTNTTTEKFAGGTGNDTLMGYGGDDSLDGGAGNDSLDGGTGNDTLVAGSGNDTLKGGAGVDDVVGGWGNDVIYGSAVTPSTSTSSVTKTALWGNSSNPGTASSTAGETDADIFRFESTSLAAAYTPSGLYSPGSYFNSGNEIKDFQSGTDKIQIAKALVGDGDTVLENVATKALSTSTFASTAELVLVSTAMTNFSYINFYGYGIYWSSPINASNVTSAIGSASTAYAVGDQRLFVLHDAYSSAVFQFKSADADAVVSSTELKLMAVVDGQTAMTAADFGLF